ncbi:MAG: glycine cleavage T C-terminal barrel domain-containing protein [Gemmatimonadaceae bacterium]
MTIPWVLRAEAPSTIDVAGRATVLHYGDIAGEYAALRTGAMLVDRSGRGRMRLDGPRATEMLTGLVTNDVHALGPGRGQYAAALTPKGKVIADIRIFARAGSLLLDVPPRARAGFGEMVRKFVNPRLAPYHDVSDSIGDIGLYGPDALSLATWASGIADDVLLALPAFGHAAAGDGVGEVIVARVPDLGLDGFELFVPSGTVERVWATLAARGATPSGLMAWEIARIEAGRPEWGVDIDDSTIPQEANMDDHHAISYTKGCYTGQEVVARVHFRGHVNKQLRGLLCGHSEPPPARAQLVDDSGKGVGDVRSSALSPRLGAVALAMVRREVEPGTTLRVQWDGGDTRADVARLPFPL